jgi:hypothetical protein
VLVASGGVQVSDQCCLFHQYLLSHSPRHVRLLAFLSGCCFRVWPPFCGLLVREICSCRCCGPCDNYIYATSRSFLDLLRSNGCVAHKVRISAFAFFMLMIWLASFSILATVFERQGPRHCGDRLPGHRRSGSRSVAVECSRSTGRPDTTEASAKRSFTFVPPVISWQRLLSDVQSRWDDSYDVPNVVVRLYLHYDSKKCISCHS